MASGGRWPDDGFLSEVQHARTMQNSSYLVHGATSALEATQRLTAFSSSVVVSTTSAKPRSVRCSPSMRDLLSFEVWVRRYWR
jgi:hypothetical protein